MKFNTIFHFATNTLSLSSRAVFSAGTSVLKFKITVIMVLCGLMLTGCSTDIRPLPEPNAKTTMTMVSAAGGAALGVAMGSTSGPIGAVFGGLIGSVIGDRLDKQRTLVSDLESYGIRFFEVGDQITIVLPSDKFFQGDSSTANTYSYAILRKVVALLNKYKTVSIKVSGYTDNQGSVDRNKALSTQRAQTVAHYLWSQGIDTRLLYAVGYGASNFVANNQTVAGRAANRRIEITLEKVQ
jgi:outer membrane protein OmpA-like peptidoglycan-associated protein